jgi:hypothetical protein
LSNFGGWIAKDRDDPARFSVCVHECATSCGSCIRVFEHNVTLDIGLWQFRVAAE